MAFLLSLIIGALAYLFLGSLFAFLLSDSKLEYPVFILAWPIYIMIKYILIPNIKKESHG